MHEPADAGPRCDQTLLEQLPAIVRAYQRPDGRKAAIQLLDTFLPFLSLWVAAYLLLDHSVGLALAIGMVNAMFLVRIFIIQHDCGHQSFTPSRKANDLIGQVCSLITFVPYRYWTRSHNYHHGHNGLLAEHRDIGDIHTLTVKEFSALGRLGKLRYALFRSVPVLFILGPPWYLLVQNRFPLVRLPGWEAARASLLRHDLALVGFYALLTAALGIEAFLWVQLPMLLVFAYIALWFFYVQHQHETAYKAPKDDWDFLRAAVHGSSHYRLPRLVNWFTGDIGYHHIHHLNPLVPNYELARCQLENPVLAQVANTIGFRQSLRCIFNKLWDEEQHRMISFREYRRLRRGV